MKAPRQYLLVALVAFLAALAGTGVGRKVMPAHAPAENELHRLLHNDIALDARQEARIEQLEKAYQARRAALEAEMRRDNAELARAIQTEHAFGPAVNAAVDKSHHAMGALQKETLRHVFAMRDELRPDQARRFEQAVVAALTSAGE